MTHRSQSQRVGFISTRFAGTDGVSLETAKWAEVLKRMGLGCFYFAGQCDRPPEQSRIVPEAYYRHPKIYAMHQFAFAGDWGNAEQARAAHPEIADLYRESFSIYVRSTHMTRQIQEIKEYLKEALYDFVRDFRINVLLVENSLAIPVHVPLGLAITELIAETGYPTIAHHHDFHWERRRFQVNSVPDYIAAAFPPNLPSIRHVVINSVAARQLASRTGLSAMVIPNVMDFASPAPPLDDYARTARADLGVGAGEYLFLQPTRIIQRKGIEHAIELTRRIGVPAKLVISHAAGDEGTAYERRVREFADLLGVVVNFESEVVQAHRARLPNGRKVYALEDIYPQADLVTYPSAIEGFGNAFLEAVYYRRPIVVNKYSIYEVDIKPKGFRVVEFDGFIDDQTLDHARHLLTHPAEAAAYAETNYSLARRYFSFEVLAHRLGVLLADCLGEAI